nr:iron ABC transporter permease [Saccharobesus litoralis]
MATCLLLLLLITPIFSLFIASLQADDGIFSHLMNTVLSTYVINTVLLVFSVCLLSLLIGLPAAWLMAMCDFKSKRFWSWAMILPLAMPAYVVAYVYTDLFDYAGPIQIALRDWFQWQTARDYWFPDIRTLGGAAIVLALVLYPYVYLLLRSAFSSQSISQLQSSRILGDSAWQSFYKISLPQARGVIVAALALIAMETMADFATVHYFAVNTLTTAIYDTWLGYYNLSAAARLSVLMLVFIALFLFIEKANRKQVKSYSRSDTFNQGALYTLNTKQTVCAIIYMAIVFFLGFVLPAIILLDYGVVYFAQAWNQAFIDYSLKSLMIAALVAGVCLLVGLVANFAARQQYENTLAQAPGQAMAAGYALPGTVLAIAVLIPLTQFESLSNRWLNDWIGYTPGLFLSGTLFAIVFAYVVRFSAITLGAVREAQAKISPNLDKASLTMGVGFSRTMQKIHMPLLTKALLSSSLLVFIEAMKELPAALLLRPFGFETLATYVYQYVSDEQLEHASLAAITIVVVGLIPLIFINNFATHDKNNSA